jgi:hypothetical protein
VAYIHHNPVRRGLVAHAEDWAWSSARDWLGKSTVAQCIVDRSLPRVALLDGRRELVN